MPKSNDGEHDCLCDLGPGETQTGFYRQGGMFKMWFSGSGKRRAYASIHIMKIRMFVINAIFAKLLYTFVFANAEKLFYYDLHVYAFVCECYDVMVTIPRVGLDIYWPAKVTIPSLELDIYRPIMVIVPSMELDIYWPVMLIVPSVELDTY